MGHTPHELTEEFPSHAETIHSLRETDSHFARLHDDYHQVNRAVHRAETNVEPVGETAEHEMRKERARLKDQIWAYLNR